MLVEVVVCDHVVGGADIVAGFWLFLPEWLGSILDERV